MQQINDTVTPPSVKQLEQAHENLNAADEGLVTDLLRTLAERTRDEIVLYLDDVEVHTIDRAGDSPHNHINGKEIVSGDATAWFAFGREYGEEIEKVDIQYGVYAGTHKNVDGYIYNPIEVVVTPK